MSKLGLRAFSAGIILATSIMGIMYYNEPKTVNTATVTDSDIEAYLSDQNHLVLIEKEEYDELLEIQSTHQETEKQEQTKAEVKIEEKIITKYILEITPGMNSLEISEVLEDVGVIKNAKELNTYILDNDLAKNIQIGSFTVTSEMTHKEIGDIITR
ncbi:MltG/YceG/YrrL family protein [Litchfieldia alkalitelluris]|uniref:hypothetical protein n=1 Tax=Litchfieldia alkalitelluris TaxID=304268 RepID=UPI0009962E34|nr:hypothetical protein [Litchfieldia alkalitelluris]